MNCYKHNCASSGQRDYHAIPETRTCLQLPLQSQISLLGLGCFAVTTWNPLYFGPNTNMKEGERKKYEKMKWPKLARLLAAQNNDSSSSTVLCPERLLENSKIFLHHHLTS